MDEDFEDLEVGSGGAKKLYLGIDCLIFLDSMRFFSQASLLLCSDLITLP